MLLAESSWESASPVCSSPKSSASRDWTAGVLYGDADASLSAEGASLIEGSALLISGAHLGGSRAYLTDLRLAAALQVAMGRRKQAVEGALKKIQFLERLAVMTKPVRRAE